MIPPSTLPPVLSALLVWTLAASAQQGTPPAVQGIRGVDQKAAGQAQQTVTPLPNPPPSSAAIQNPSGVNQVDGVKTRETVESTVPPPPHPHAVRPVPPPPRSQAAGTIRPVRGIHGIQTPKRQNLEAVLRIKEETRNAPPQSRAAAAALFRAPAQQTTKPEQEDGRTAFEEFAKQTATGS